ncbi:zinc-ribbon domain-containing protein [Blastococcus sp. MG754426]|nr:zinc-ribbon domain-containing protein [Blastococcus sp. MG754426]MCF6514125.1 zinc-ribbon domain-containing protein [Blastococcus sp. MG754427]MCF6737471.1 zinc-ribbon domain-containing protein [Blastococcus sp. KM273129]
MFLLLGFGTKREHLGPGATRTCPNCHTTSRWSRVRQYRQFSLFFVPVARWKRRELEVCGVCGAAVEV